MYIVRIWPNIAAMLYKGGVDGFSPAKKDYNISFWMHYSFRERDKDNWKHDHDRDPVIMINIDKHDRDTVAS